MNNLGMCHDCHFLRDNPSEIHSNGKIFPCSNIGVSGWDYWLENQSPPKQCEEYCKKGEYVPTGIWAGLAEVVRKVGDLVEEKKEQGK